MLKVLVRSLRHEVSITAPNRPVADTLAFLRSDPEIEGRWLPRYELVVGMAHGFPSLVLPDGARIEGSDGYLRARLHEWLFGWRQKELLGALVGNGATITTEAGHILLVGDKGQGKTTLLLYLMALGWPVAGWQDLFLSGQLALPNPVPFRIPLGMLDHLPGEAAEIVRAAPSIITLEGSPIYAVCPTAFGHPWNIRSRPVRQVVFVSGNQGGRSRLRRIDWETAMQRVLKAAVLPPANRAGALADIAATMSGAERLELWNGRVEESRRLLQSALHLPKCSLRSMRRAIAFDACKASTASRSLPLKGGGSGWGSEHAPRAAGRKHATTSRMGIPMSLTISMDVGCPSLPRSRHGHASSTRKGTPTPTLPLSGGGSSPPVLLDMRLPCLQAHAARRVGHA
ncbi:MAG: hypothetical protein K2Z80_04145 [Xanthobacteraceae bacterium]|nr:hypothetical protein [Xanthobacteraceae bacterium]